MEEALRFFRAYEVWIYLLLGLGGVFYIRKFMLAWQELRGAGFGLERFHAQTRLNQSASMLVLLLTMTVTEFVLVSLIAPVVPGAMPAPTPTLNLVITPSLPAAAQTPLVGGVSEPVSPLTPAPPLPVVGGCIPGQIEITSPKEGDEVSGVVEITGSANLPNFSFYKYEMSRPGDPADAWKIIQAGDKPKQNESLGVWDTRLLPPGDYQLGLVVVDNQAKPSPACVVQVRVKTAAETPEAP